MTSHESLYVVMVNDLNSVEACLMPNLSLFISMHALLFPATFLLSSLLAHIPFGISELESLLDLFQEQETKELFPNSFHIF